MKLEVGMYVRTKDGEIGKITHIETENFSSPAYTLDIFPQGIYKGCEWFEGKASHNIIDLIEVGDYVNGHQVYDDFRADTDDYGNNFIEIGIESDRFLNHYIREDEIKSIVTKEQFESMSYVVKQ